MVDGQFGSLKGADNLIVDRIFRKINSLESHGFYYLSPCTYAFGTNAIEVRDGIIKAKNLNKRLVILYMFSIPFIFKYKLTNRYLFSLESEFIFKPSKYILFLSRFLLTIVYIPLRQYFLLVKKITKTHVCESYSYPRIGVEDLYRPKGTKSDYIFDLFKNDNVSYRPYDCVNLNLEGYHDHELALFVEKIGIPKGANFVCLHVRESGFYGDKGRREYRNSDIMSYIPAIKEITAKGLWVVRMGDASMTKLPNMMNVIDYPFHKYKSDFVDMCLVKSCYFMMATPSGLLDIATLFNKPTLLVNQYNWLYSLSSYGMELIQHVYSSKKKRYLPLKEMYTTDFKIDKKTGHIDLKDYTLVPNTETEILSSVLEFMDFIKGERYIATKLQMLVKTLRKDVVYNNVKNSVFNVKNVENLFLLYRNARHFLDKDSFVCDFYVKNNWEEDSMNHKINL